MDAMYVYTITFYGPQRNETVSVLANDVLQAIEKYKVVEKEMYIDEGLLTGEVVKVEKGPLVYIM